MDVPHSAPGDVGRTAVLIALRSLDGGKARLHDALTLAERVQLIRLMAERVIASAHDLDVLVVHDDPKVESWAVERGAATLRPSQPGLNTAITAGRDHLRAAGYERVIVAHADLPYAEDLRVMVTRHRVAIVADRHGDGTNAMAIATNLDFSFAYGPGSFENHVRMARDLGIEPHIVDAPGLAWDVDHPDDLTTDLRGQLGSRTQANEMTNPDNDPLGKSATDFT